LHPRSLHQGAYDFEALSKIEPELEQFLINKVDGKKSLDFSDHKAILLLNKAILRKEYKIEYWDIPNGYLCPAIPGRADYIHHIADLLTIENEIPRGRKITCLDIGTGANLIYPLLGNKIYGWKFVATEIDQRSVRCAKGIAEANDLKSVIDIRLQPNQKAYFSDILKENEFISAVICNPPFYASEEEALKANERKNQNLALPSVSNFQGVNNELWCEGGELEFIKGLIADSKIYSKKLKWISSLVSKTAHLENLEKFLVYQQVREHKIIPLELGNKKSRILAWRF